MSNNVEQMSRSDAQYECQHCGSEDGVGAYRDLGGCYCQVCYLAGLAERAARRDRGREILLDALAMVGDAINLLLDDASEM